MNAGFNWFTGVAYIDAPCPVEFLGNRGLQPFFERPNDPAWGISLTRRLYHESLHFWQLVSSRYLQMIIVREWERLLKFERDGVIPPISEQRRTFGRAAANEPFSIRDLIECLARFWDVHTRGPTRLIREEGNDLGGKLKEIDLIRPQDGYSSLEFDTVMLTGPDCELYAKPYHWMIERARASPAVRALPGPIEEVASWSVNLLLPITSFLALNTEAPIAAFVAGFERCLSQDVLDSAMKRRNPRKVINFDWLDFWSVIAKGLSRTLRRIGLSTWLGHWVGFGVLENEAFINHPVYRHLRARMTSLDNLLDSFKMKQSMKYALNPPSGDIQNIDEAMILREVYVTEPDRWPVFSLPGQPTFRSFLGGTFAPPLIRFNDTDLLATSSAFPDWPWPIGDNILTTAIDEAETRFTAMYEAEAASRFNLPPNAFER